jgi:transcription elongation factor Elf1
MNNHHHCLICSSAELVPLKDFQQAHLCKCKKCGFVFSQRIPSEQELIDH